MRQQQKRFLFSMCLRWCIEPLAALKRRKIVTKRELWTVVYGCCKVLSFFPLSSLFAVINVIPYMIPKKIYKAIYNPSVLATHFADLTYFQAMIQLNGNMGIINYYVHAVSIHYITIITSVCVFFPITSCSWEKNNNKAIENWQYFIAETFDFVYGLNFIFYASKSFFRIECELFRLKFELCVLLNLFD